VSRNQSPGHTPDKSIVRILLMHIAFPGIPILSHATHHFPRITHCAHLSVGVNIFTSPKTKSEFMQPSNLMIKTAPLSIKNIPSSKLYPSQFFECTLEFSVANLHVIMEKEEGCSHR